MCQNCGCSEGGNVVIHTYPPRGDRSENLPQEEHWHPWQEGHWEPGIEHPSSSTLDTNHTHGSKHNHGSKDDQDPGTPLPHGHDHIHDHANHHSHDHAHNHSHDHASHHSHDHSHDHANYHSHDHASHHSHDHAHNHSHDRSHPHHQNHQNYLTLPQDNHSPDPHLNGSGLGHTHSPDHSPDPQSHHRHHPPSHVLHPSQSDRPPQPTSWPTTPVALPPLTPETDGRVIAIEQAILGKNDHLASQNREYFQKHGVLALNLLSSPGSGKTTLLEKTLIALDQSLRIGVIVGDLATDNDAQRLRTTQSPIIQITTGNLCHLEADMVLQAAQHLNLDRLDVLVIENVGNLVCPSVYDLGEQVRVVLLSVTEGEDKPLKYPHTFKSAHWVVLTKIDIADAVGFDRSKALESIRRVAPQAQILELSARTGAGMDQWFNLLKSACLIPQA